jgi:hypothetical protein
MARRAATTKDDLLDAAERGDATATAQLVALTAQEQAEQHAREQVRHEIHERTVERTRREEQERQEQTQRDNHARAIAVRGEERALAGEIEVLIVQDLRQKISTLLTLAKEHYALTGSRASLAAPERLGEFLLHALGLPSPWATPRDRKRFSLPQTLGLDPREPPTPAQAPQARPVRSALLDDDPGED